MFFSSFRQFKPIAVPRPVVLSTGSNALRPYYEYDWAVACSVQHRDLHFRLDRYRDAAEPNCITAGSYCREDLPLMINSNCCNCSAAGRAQRLEWVRRQLDPPATFSSILSQNVQLSTDDEAFARRVSSATCTTGERSLQPSNPSSSPAPTSLTFGSKKTDNDNAKQQKRKIEDNSNCSQPLACAQASHPVFKQAGERPALRSPGWNHRCPRSNKRHFFHCTIARLAAAHTFLLAEISRHALTDLSIGFGFVCILHGWHKPAWLPEKLILGGSATLNEKKIPGGRPPDPHLPQSTTPKEGGWYTTVDPACMAQIVRTSVYGNIARKGFKKSHTWAVHASHLHH